MGNRKDGGNAGRGKEDEVEMRIIDTKKTAAAIINILEKGKIPIGCLDEILNQVRESVLYFTPIVGHGPVGLPLESEQPEKNCAPCKHSVPSPLSHEQ